MATVSKSPAPVNASQTVSEAFATIMRHNLDYLLVWEDAAKNWDDIEGVHQFRVTVRRMRSALTLFRDAIPKERSRHWGDELRWMAGEMGLARDLDVFIDEGLGCIADNLPLKGADKLMSLAKVSRARVYENIVRPMLESDRYRQFKQAFAQWIDERAWEQGEVKSKVKERLEMNLVAYSRLLMDKQERKVLSAGSHVDQHSPQQMHRLRIECKKLRYAAEFFSPLFLGMDVFIGHMRGLQDLLGKMNDIAVMKGLLDFLFEEAQVDRELMVYTGGLIGWRTCDFHQTLEHFDKYWEEFTEAKHPWWKKSALVK